MGTVAKLHPNQIAEELTDRPYPSPSAMQCLSCPFREACRLWNGSGAIA